jgi:flavin reductase ActVB
MAGPDIDSFKAALAEFPSGVTIVSTIDTAGHPRGFTASSFCSLSMSPPLVLVCLAESAECSDAFTVGRSFSIALLDSRHEPLARAFATRGVDKFASDAFELAGEASPRLRDGVFVVDCVLENRYPAGDHSILVGAVCEVKLQSGAPLLYHRRAFRGVESTSSLG